MAKEIAKAVEEPEVPKKKSKAKLILIFLIIFVVLLGAAGAFWFFTIREPGQPAPTPPPSNGEVSQSGIGQTMAGDTPSAVVDTPRPASVVQLPTVNVNLLDASQDRYLKMSLEIEVSHPEAVQEVQLNQARIRDALIILLSSKTYDELATAEGKMQLKNEIASRINQILGTPRVIRVYYTDFVIT